MTTFSPVPPDSTRREADGSTDGSREALGHDLLVGEEAAEVDGGDLAAQELAPVIAVSPSTSERPTRLQAAVARHLGSRLVRDMPVDVVLPDGSLLQGSPDADTSDDGTTRPALEVARPDVFFSRLVTDQTVGLGEGYMAGDWHPAPGTDLAEILLPFAERVTLSTPSTLQRLSRLVGAAPSVPEPTPHPDRPTSRDLGQEFFAAFLDPTLTCSSALFDSSRPFSEQDLGRAQVRKTDAVLDRARVRPGSRILEVGGGWGALAIRAANRGARVTTTAFTPEEAELVRERAEQAEVADRIEVVLGDHRDIEGTFDAVVSVEVVETLGADAWPEFFSTLDARLVPGGVAVIQSVLREHSALEASRGELNWAQKHVATGSLAPSLEAIERVTTAHTSLRTEEVHRFGLHYAETVRRWRERFVEQWASIAHQGFDETFRRTWEFHLARCEASFASGLLDVALVTFVRSEAVAA